MKTQKLTPILCLCICILYCIPHVRAEAPPWRNMPKKMEWKGKVNGEEVEILIKAGEFIKSNYKTVKEDKNSKVITKIGNYDCYFGRPRNGVMPPHITEWTIRWAGKDVKMPRDVYASVFLPALYGVTRNFNESISGTKLWIGKSSDDQDLMIIMLCGFDAQHARIAFIISKDGSVKRFFIEAIS